MFPDRRPASSRARRIAWRYTPWQVLLRASPARGPPTNRLREISHARGSVRRKFRSFALRRRSRQTGGAKRLSWSMAQSLFHLRQSDLAGEAQVLAILARGKFGHGRNPLAAGTADSNPVSFHITMVSRARRRMLNLGSSGRGAAWLARLLGVQEVPGSNPGGPTKFLKDLQAPNPTEPLQLGPNWVQFRSNLEHGSHGIDGMLGALCSVSRDGDDKSFPKYMQNRCLPSPRTAASAREPEYVAFTPLPMIKSQFEREGRFPSAGQG